MSTFHLVAGRADGAQVCGPTRAAACKWDHVVDLVSRFVAYPTAVSVEGNPRGCVNHRRRASSSVFSRAPAPRAGRSVFGMCFGPRELAYLRVAGVVFFQPRLCVFFPRTLVDKPSCVRDRVGDSVAVARAQDCALLIYGLPIVRARFLARAVWVARILLSQAGGTAAFAVRVQCAAAFVRERAFWFFDFARQAGAEAHRRDYARLQLRCPATLLPVWAAAVVEARV